MPVEMPRHMVLERDGFVALVERTEDGFGNIGSSGLMTEHGLALLIWRASQPVFVARGFESPAEPAQVLKLRAFAADLEAALRTG